MAPLQWVTAGGYVRDGQVREFVRRESPEDSFYCRFAHCEREPLDFRRECIETARRIRDNTNFPIWVLASGGMDSEIVIRSFHAAGIPVRVAINLYRENLNLHDVAFATALCQSLGIQYRVFNDTDLEEFYLSDAPERYAEIAQTITVPLIPLVGLLEHLDGYTISGTGTLDFLRRGYYVPGALQRSESIRPRHRLREIGGLRTPGFERLRRKLGEPGPL